MNKRLAFVLPLLAVLFFGCVKDPVPPVSVAMTLRVEPMWNGQPFDKTLIYLNALDQRVQVSQVKFYLSGLTVIGLSGEEKLSDAILVDITNGPVSRTLSAPQGRYDSLRYAIGLPYAVNHTDLLTIDPNSDLGNNSGMYWTWASQYRFLLFEGLFDNDPNGSGTPPFSFSIHTGHDECYRQRTIHVPFVVTSDGHATLTLRVDVARFFQNGTETLDLTQGSQSHGEVQTMPIALTLSDLAVASVSAQ